MSNLPLEPQDNERQNQGMMEFFLVAITTILFPPILLFGFFVVHPRQEIVALRFGKFVKILKNEGIRWTHPVGRTLHRIPTKDMTLDIPTTTVLEKNGNPINISAVVVYRVEESYKAALDVEDYNSFIGDQAGAVIKRCSSQFPYESSDHSGPSLKGESEDVSHAYITELQEAVNAAGIRVLSVRLNDLTYAPEIAQAMLMRQQAMALIDARKTIVEGAVEIVKDAVDKLAAADLQMSDDQRETLISNLLVVICSGERAQPVMQIQSKRKS